MLGDGAGCRFHVAAPITAILLKNRHEFITKPAGRYRGSADPLGAGSCPCPGLTRRFFLYQPRSPGNPKENPKSFFFSAWMTP